MLLKPLSADMGTKHLINFCDVTYDIIDSTFNMKQDVTLPWVEVSLWVAGCVTAMGWGVTLGHWLWHCCGLRSHSGSLVVTMPWVEVSLWVVGCDTAVGWGLTLGRWLWHCRGLRCHSGLLVVVTGPALWLQCGTDPPTHQDRPVVPLQTTQDCLHRDGLSNI